MRLILLGILSVVSAYFLLTYSPSAMTGGLLGGNKEVKGAQNDVELEQLGRFAVEEHNSKENAGLSFGKVVAAKEQVVQGKMHTLTIEATKDGNKGHYEARVWVKPWENHKSLEGFKSMGPSLTAADLGANRAHDGVRDVAVDDATVSQAADTAVKALQQRSNSLLPYELKEVLSAKAKTEDGTLYTLALKLGRGKQEEHIEAEVHHSASGEWKLKSQKPTK
eukprot:jgi/Mesen1/1242/ME000129S00342